MHRFAGPKYAHELELGQVLELSVWDGKRQWPAPAAAAANYIDLGELEHWQLEWWREWRQWLRRVVAYYFIRHILWVQWTRPERVYLFRERLSELAGRFRRFKRLFKLWKWHKHLRRLRGLYRLSGRFNGDFSSNAATATRQQLYNKQQQLQQQQQLQSPTEPIADEPA